MRELLAALVLAGAAFSQVKPLVEGHPGSTVRAVIYEDLQCSDCANFRLMLDRQILPKYGSKVAFEHRDFPLPKHKWARPASVAALYFQTVKPELAVEWRRYAMSHQSEITAENFPSKLSAWAAEHGIDSGKVAAALNDKALNAEVEDQYQDGVARGIAHTPTVLVNGEPFIETFTFEEISQGLDKALREQ